MDKQLAARKARMTKELERLLKHFEEMANTAEHLNRRFDEPVDVEGFRLRAWAAREALRAVRENRLPIEPRLMELLKPEETDQ